MPKMTQEDLAKSNHLAEVLDGMFNHKPGDLVCLKVSFEHVKAEALANTARDRTARAYDRRGALKPVTIAERVLKECPGNVQCFYALHVHEQTAEGTRYHHITVMDHEVIPWSDVEAFYQATGKDAEGK